MNLIEAVVFVAGFVLIISVCSYALMWGLQRLERWAEQR